MTAQQVAEVYGVAVDEIEREARAQEPNDSG
jgi:hypothetical protein